MRAINVSTEVFAAIWSARSDGEDSENAILERVLKVQKRPTENGTLKERVLGSVAERRNGIYLPEYDLHFQEGFEIFRVYKGKRFTATVNGGGWFLKNDSRRYPSLHKLSWAVVGGRENSWTNWRYPGPQGGEKLIDELRPKDKVRRHEKMWHD
jgi:hypothetical protein